MISIQQLNEMTEPDFVSLLGPIYEESPHFAAAVYGQRPFTKREALQQALQAAVTGATAEAQHALILAHPDLAGKLAAAGQLTEASSREQAGAGLDFLSDDERAIFTELNTRYRERFGFPFIICVKETAGKADILETFSRRLQNDEATESSEALKQIHRIAANRLADLIPHP